MLPLSNIQIASPRSFDETIETLRAAIVAADMMILHEIDTQSIVARAGILIPGVRQLLYFHPRWMPSSSKPRPMRLSKRRSNG